MEYNLQLLHINIQSLANKIDVLELICSNYKPTVICLTEHWMCVSKITNSWIEGYQLVSYFCRADSDHGGSAIFVKSDIAKNCNNIEYLVDLYSELHFECSAIVINKVLCIVTIYRSSSVSSDTKIFLDKLYHLLEYITAKYPYVIVNGDFNINFLEQTNNKKLLFDILDMYNLTLPYYEPTRIARYGNHVTSTGLDYIVSNIRNANGSVKHFGISDHSAQIIQWNEKDFAINHDNKKTELISRKFNDNTVSEFKTIYRRYYENIVPDDIDVMFDNFFSHFQWCFEAAFPKQKKVIHSNCKKITFSVDLHNELNKLKEVEWLRKRVNDPQLDDRYKKGKRALNKRIVEEKRHHNANIINNSNNKTKALWKLVNKKRNTIKGNENLYLVSNGKEICEEKEIADLFGNYFANAIKDRINTLDLPLNECTKHQANHYNSLFFTPVSEHEIKDIIIKLKKKYSAGIDDIPGILLEKCVMEISDDLARIVNLSVTTGKFPNKLKSTKVVPVFKKGDIHAIENYRMICLLSCFSKIMETAVYKQLINFLNHHKIITPCQHGFRPNFSIETASIELVQYIYNNLDKNKLVVGLFFDLSRAFDTLNQEFLKEKLNGMGIRGPVQLWLISYISNRELKVKINNTYSDPYDITIGTPQGGILGPLLFLLYMNDLPHYIRGGEVFIYADDTTIIVAADNITELSSRIQSIIKDFDDWCKRNHLINNINKTVLLQFTNPHQTGNNLKFKMNNTEIQTSESTVFLGSQLDSKLNFNQHIEYVCKKLNKLHFAFKSLKSNFQRNHLVNLYYALVYSIICCNIQVWGRATDAFRVFIIQKRFIRLIFDLGYLQSCRETFRNEGLLTFTCIYLYKIILYTRQNINKFQLNKHVHNYDTRTKENIHLNQINRMQYKKSPYYAGGYYYNLLPNELKDIENINKFKISLKIFLIEQTFYSLDEYINLDRNKKEM